LKNEKVHGNLELTVFHYVITGSILGANILAYLTWKEWAWVYVVITIGILIFYTAIILKDLQFKIKNTIQKLKESKE